MIDFYSPQHSQAIIELYLKQFSQDVEDVLGIELETYQLSPEKIFVLSHKCQLKWLRDEVQNIDLDEDFHHDIFEVLTDSEYSQGFLELIQNPGVSFESAVNLTLDYYQNQVQLIEEYHLRSDSSKIASEFKVSDAYQINQDLGDYEANNNDKEVIIGGHPKSITQSSVILRDQSPKITKVQSRVEETVSKLKRLTPLCFKRLENFTKYLVPTFSTGMVSFSSESLPFYSCINFDERDDIDLLDDLLHENGHHQLNLFLYIYEFIDESDPNLYFSPWRESLRPLRGIYHGFCTFFWACDLFYHLLMHKDLEIEFSAKDIEKIKWRFNEELHLLKMAYPHIQLAYERGFVSRDGMEVAANLFEKIKTYQNSCYKSELNSTNSKEFQILRDELESKRQECEKSL